MVAEIKVEECLGCGACEEVCPQDAITIEDGIAVVSDDCVDCGACADECPNDAITV